MKNIQKNSDGTITFNANVLSISEKVLSNSNGTDYQLASFDLKGTVRTAQVFTNALGYTRNMGLGEQLIIARQVNDKMFFTIGLPKGEVMLASDFNELLK